MANATLGPQAPEIHRDPLSGAPDAHPVGAGVGAAVGAGTGGALLGGGTAAFAGTAAGWSVLGGGLSWFAGPIGVAVGAVAGGIVGGLIGKRVAHVQDAQFEDLYWRERFKTCAYVSADATFEDYQPAYRYGFEARLRHEGRRFEEIEAELQKGWEDARGSSRLSWEQARPAVMDEWDRMDQALAATAPSPNSEPPAEPGPTYFPPML